MESEADLLSTAALLPSLPVTHGPRYLSSPRCGDELEYLSKNSHPKPFYICLEGPRAQKGLGGVPWLEEVWVYICEALAVYLEWFWGVVRINGANCLMVLSLWQP